jgi:hypothetical protein
MLDCLNWSLLTDPRQPEELSYRALIHATHTLRISDGEADLQALLNLGFPLRQGAEAKLRERLREGKKKLLQEERVGKKKNFNLKLFFFCRF